MFSQERRQGWSPGSARWTAVVLVGALLLGGGCGNRRPLKEAFVQGGPQEVPPWAAELIQRTATSGVGALPGTGALPEAGPEAAPATPEASGSAGAVPAVAAGGSAGRATSPGGSVPKAASSAAPGKSAASASAPAASTPGSPGSGGSAPNPSAGARPGQTPGPIAAGPAQYDQGVSDTEIKFASVSSLTGLFADFMQPRGARAYFKYVSSQGGVNGRKLSLLIYDDQWDATRNAALTRQAFESDKVFAFVSNGAPLSSHGGRGYVEQHTIPVIGGDMIDLQDWGKSPMYYPQSYLESVAGGRLAGRWAAKVGCTKAAGFSLAVDESRSWTKQFEVGLKDGGLPGYVYSADISLAETDYTPYVATAKSKGADCLTMGGQTTTFIRLRKAMAQQNYKAQLVLPSSAYDPQYTQASAPEGDYSMIQYDLLENKDTNPAVREFIEQATRFEPGMKQSGYALLSWTAAKIAVHALGQMGNVVTRQNMIDTLNGFTEFDTGVTPKITYRPGPHPGATCGNMAQYTGGRWVMAAANLCV